MTCKIEHEIQSAFIAEARKIPGAEQIHAIPNAVPVRTRGMSKEAAKIARIIAQKYSTAEGRLPGVLDVFNPKPVMFSDLPNFYGLYIEFKRPSSQDYLNGHSPAGTLTPEQAEFIMYADENGYAVAVCYSTQDGIDTLLRYLKGEHSNVPAVELARKRLKK